jgi:hypothetical protein
VRKHSVDFQSPGEGSFSFDQKIFFGVSFLQFGEMDRLRLPREGEEVGGEGSVEGIDVDCGWIGLD